MSVGLKANVDGSGAIQVGGTDAINLSTGLNATFVQNANLPNTFGFKNRIINGAMVIDQRNAGAEVNPAVNAAYYVDRWNVQSTQTSKFKIGQNAGSATLPAGYTKYLGCTSLSAYSVTSSDVFSVQQRIEGLNCSDLAWGTASAATVTLSFWVQSSLTGTFGGALRNSDNTRTYPFSYTISAANTWEQKSVTIAGDTSGTWLTTNGIGIVINFSLGTGSTLSGTAGSWSGSDYRSVTGATSVVGTNGATFYITGVQLEKGSTATSFDYRPYGTELSLCQRYCAAINPNMAIQGFTNTVLIPMYNTAQFRAAPTITIPYTDASFTSSSSPSSTQWGLQTLGVAAASKTGTITFNSISIVTSNLYGIYMTGATFSIATNWIAAGSSISNIIASAEL